MLMSSALVTASVANYAQRHLILKGRSDGVSKGRRVE